MESLIARLEAAKGPFSTDDAEAMLHALKGQFPKMTMSPLTSFYHAISAPQTFAIGYAVAFCEAMLPGCKWFVGADKQAQVWVHRDRNDGRRQSICYESDEDVEKRVTPATPAIALVLATLKAKEAK